MLHASTALTSKVFLTTYLEADFLQSANRAPFRWRQYWSELSFGKWKLLGGQGWSLLRPNRFSEASDVELLNTLVVEPAYHIGLTGLRRRQLRLTREFAGGNTAAFEWESGGRFQTKIAHDWSHNAHIEVIAMAGTRGRLGMGLSQTLLVRPWLRLVGEEFWSKGGGPEMLSILPPLVHAYSSIQGAEMPFRRGAATAYAYGGLVYGARSAGNRLARQYTVGMLHRIYRGQPGAAFINLQFSQFDRAVWDGRSGSLAYLMASVRYSFPPPR
jgi:hypothetical protein